MRDGRRIDSILKQLQTYWKKYPSLRLTQVVHNMSEPAHGDVFYVEDDVIYNNLLKAESDEIQTT